MTEAEWLECEESGWPRVLEFVAREGASDRKLRLFACAGCRVIWERLSDERSRRAIEVAERFADDPSQPEFLEAQCVAREMYETWVSAWHASRRPIERVYRSLRPEQAVLGAVMTTLANPLDDEQVEFLLACLLTIAGKAWESTERHHRNLLRDIFGCMVSPVTISPSLLSWKDCTVPEIARAIYENGMFDDLPVLADALEEAGCDNNAILTHCRQPGEHVRGCWVVDLLLGKE